MKNKFIYYPLIYLLVLFGVDKVFTLSYFKKEFLQTGNVVYYRHREELFERFKKEFPNPKKKIIVGMGDSRAYAFSSLAYNEDRKKIFTIYNFSAPQAVVAYSLQWLETFVQEKTIPYAIFLVLSPEGFDDKKKILHKPFLRLGAKKEFIEKYFDHFPEGDKEEYLLDKWIAFRSLEFDFKLFIERIKTKKLKEYKPLYNLEYQILNLYHGEQLAYTSVVNDEKRLIQDSQRMARIYLNNFEIHDTQFFFLEKFLQIAKENNIIVFLVLPKVYPEYRKTWEKLGIMKDWWVRVINLAEKYNARAYDLENFSDCNLFYDASHQSTICYGKQVNFLTDELEKIYFKERDL